MSITFTKGYFHRGHLVWDISKIIRGVRWTARMILADVPGGDFKEHYHEHYRNAVRMFTKKENECRTT